MNTEEPPPILKRVGTVLIAVGLINIAVMIYCIINHVSYSSSFNIFAVIAGVFLWRGNLRAVRIVAFFTVFYFSCLLLLIAATLVVQPFGLTSAYLRLHPFSFALAAVMNCILLFVMLWVIQSLRADAVLAAQRAHNVKIQSPLFPAACGGLLVGLAVWIGNGATGGDVGRHATELARQQLGDDYQYYVTSYSHKSVAGEASSTATITAWSNTDIREITVQWPEPKSP